MAAKREKEGGNRGRERKTRVKVLDRGLGVIKRHSERRKEGTKKKKSNVSELKAGREKERRGRGGS